MVKTITMSSFPSYVFFWIGQLVSIFGSIVVFFSLNMWLITTVGSALTITIASLSFLIPFILTLLIGGVVADKFDRKKVILLVDSIQALSIFIMWLFFTFNFMEFWTLYFFFAIRSVCQAFHIPTEFAIIPTMVPKKQLNRINGIAFVVIEFIQIIGPIVGNRLFIFHSIKQILWVDIITFLISIVPLILVKIPSVKKEQETLERISFWRQFRVGFKALIRAPGLVFLMILILIFSFLILPFDSLLSLYITTVHMGSYLITEQIRLSLTIGIFIGGIISAIKGTWVHKTPIITLMIILHGIMYVLFVFVPIGHFFLMIIYSIIGGLTIPIIYSIFLTILQTSVPYEKVGRLSSIYNTFNSGITYVGLTVSGYLTNFIGIGMLFIVCASVNIIVTILIFLFTPLQKIDYIKEVSES